MSLIDDALKKTQSALKQKPVVSSDASPSHEKIEIPRPIINPKMNAAILDRKKRHYFSEEKRDSIAAFLKNRYFILTMLVLILGSLITFTHDKVHRVAERYAHFYGQFFDDLSIKPTTPTKRKTPSTPAFSVVPLNTLSLDGTLEAGQAHAALINNELYHTGETVGGYTIRRIDYNQVILVDPNTHQTHILQTTLHQ